MNANTVIDTPENKTALANTLGLLSALCCFKLHPTMPTMLIDSVRMIPAACGKEGAVWKIHFCPVSFVL